MLRPASVHLALLAFLGACAADQTPAPAPPPPAPPGAEVPADRERPIALVEAPARAVEGLRLIVSEAKPGPAKPRAPVQTRPISAERAAELLAALAPLPAESAEPLPRIPPPATASVSAPLWAPTTSPLPRLEVPPSVIRTSPTGNVRTVSQIAITFSGPMRPAVPARWPRLEPDVPGRWRWLGTDTLLFDPAGPRLAMATPYRVEIPKDLATDESGQPLAEPVTFAFETPPVRSTAFHPRGNGQPLELVAFAAFDQRIDPQAVLQRTTLIARGRSFPLRLARPEEIERDATVKRLLSEATPGHAMAFVTSEILPPATRVRVRVGPGVVSQEGPKKTVEAETFSFRTYAPFAVTKSACAHGGTCAPGASFELSLTNPVDAQSFTPSMVTVRPPLDRMAVELDGRALKITGDTRGRTTYQIEIDPRLADIYGQALGRPAKATFEVGSAVAQLNAPGRGIVVLDPSAPAVLPVFSAGYPELAVEIWTVTPRDWPAYLHYVSRPYDKDAPQRPPGTRVYRGVLPVNEAGDALVETAIDLSPYLSNGLGHLVVEVQPPKKHVERWQRTQPPTIRKWVQATRIGMDGFVDHTELFVWTSSLADGAPISVRVSIEPDGVEGITGADGTLRQTLPLPSAALGRDAILLARAGGDSAFVPESQWYRGSSAWAREARPDTIRYFVFDDRGVYRPGERVRFKGWVRRLGGGELGDVSELEGPTSLSYSVRSARGEIMARGEANLSAQGGFAIEVQLPEDAEIGTSQLTLQTLARPTGVAGGPFQHFFRVEQIRQPEFEVITGASEAPHVVGQYATVNARGQYFTGGGLPRAAVKWDVTTRDAAFTPPGRARWTFGRWTPWWDSRFARGGVNPTPTQTVLGETDADGRHELRIDFAGMDPPHPKTVSAEVTITDAHQQAWSATETLLVHPAALYVGLDGSRAFVRKGEELKVRAIVVDLQGRAVPNRQIDVVAARLQWTKVDEEWRQIEVDGQSCTITSQTKAVICRFAAGEAGRHRIRARVVDDRGRANESELSAWVAGDTATPSRDLDEGRVELIPAKKRYKPGDMAEVLVLAPFAPAEGLLTVRRSGILTAQRFTMRGHSHVLRMRVEDLHVPNLHVEVDLVGATPRIRSSAKPEAAEQSRPAFASGSLNLPVAPAPRTLEVTVKPRKTRVRPKDSTQIDVTVRNAAGAPVPEAEVALMVVEEGTWASTQHRVPSPIEVFYSQRPGETSELHSRAYVLLPGPGDSDSARTRRGPTAAEREHGAFHREEIAADATEDAPASLHRELTPLALFEPKLITDAEGRVTVPLRVPDALTRYRVVALAVGDARSFGRGEASIVASKPLSIRSSPPRFASFADRFDLPIVLENQTSRAMPVEIAVRAYGAALWGPPGLAALIPPRDRIEVTFPVATDRAGVTKIQIAALSGTHADAIELKIPVREPLTTEVHAIDGELVEGSVLQPVARPLGTVSSFGGLELEASPTRRGTLAGAAGELSRPSFEHAETIATRVLILTALGDVLTGPSGAYTSRAELDTAIARDLRKLTALINDDGGYGFTRGESWPFVSAHVNHAFARATAAGYSVPKETIARGRAHLASFPKPIPSRYPASVRHTIEAYALYVRARFSEVDGARAKRLIREAGGVQKLPMEMAAWLYPVLAKDPSASEELAQVRRLIEARAEVRNGAAHFVTSYRTGEQLLLHTPRRVDAVVLEGLLADQPAHPLVDALTEGLLRMARGSEALSPQELGWALLALDARFAARATNDRATSMRAWVGARLFAQVNLLEESVHARVPFAELPPGKSIPLWIAKQGPGRLYYRIGLRHAANGGGLWAESRGFSVERRFEAVDDPDDVSRDEDGTWRAKAGASVRVRVTLAASEARHLVALVDRLPAGFEARRPALPPAEPLESRLPAWWTQEVLGDARVEVFALELPAGVFEYSYVARATTKGTFVVPPAYAEEMYAPQFSGRSKSDRLVVE